MNRETIIQMAREATADPQARLKFWRELNDYAVSQRGKSAKCEFEYLPDGIPVTT